MGIGHGWYFHRSVYPVSVCRGIAAVVVTFVMVACAGAQSSNE